MRIGAVTSALPAQQVSNDDVIELIRQHSTRFDGDLDETLRQVRFWLGMSGSSQRRWSGTDERPIDLLCAAGLEALETAGVAADSIDLVIYTGVGRGFIEPGGAYHAAAALGIQRAQCFDVLDACMSWTRAVQIADGLFQSGAASTALLVNAEFNLRSDGYVNPHVFALSSPEAVTWSFPAFTLGEAATATVLVKDDQPGWDFAFASRPDLADLCNVPLPGYDGFCSPSDKIAKNGTGYFTSFGAELHSNGQPEALAVFQRLDVAVDDVDVLFTHASSKRWWDERAHDVGLGHAIHHVYPHIGNVVSASVPAAMADAVAQGRMRRGDRATVWVGSAGMSFAAFTFAF